MTDERIREDAKELKPEYKPDAKAKPEQIKTIMDKMQPERMQKMMEYYGIKKLGDLTAAQAGRVLSQLAKEEGAA